MPATTAQETDPRDHVRIPEAVKQSIATLVDVPLTDERLRTLTAWIADTLPRLRQQRDERVSVLEREYMRTLRGERAYPSPDNMMSNVSVPLQIWASAGVRQRVNAGLWRIQPIVTAEPVRAPGEMVALDDAKGLSKFLEGELLSPHALDGKRVGTSFVNEVCNFGVSAFGVALEADEPVRMLVAGKPSTGMRKGRPRWFYIGFRNLIYWPDYGLDIQRMPYVGFETDKTWGSIVTWAEAGHYDADAVEKVKAWYTASTVAGRSNIEHAYELKPHRVAELYLDYVVDDTNIVAPILLDWHIEAAVPLRIRWNVNLRGHRSLYVAQFDANPDETQLVGMGVCDKLRGAQLEADEVHNIGIEAGKGAACFIKGIRYGTNAELEFGGTRRIYPNDTYVTEDPETDIVTKALGDPSAAQICVQLEDRTRSYTAEILGFDRSRIGDVEAGKRVPSSLGLPIMREGRVPIENCFDNVTQAFTDALYHTITLYREALPLAALRRAVGDDAAARLSTTIFDLAGQDPRDLLVLNVRAQDAASIIESRKQEMLVLGQYLFGLYDRLLAYAEKAATLPPQYATVVMDVLAKVQNAARILVTNVESIQYPQEVIPEVAEAMQRLSQIAQAGMGGGMPGNGGMTGNDGGGEGAPQGI